MKITTIMDNMTSRHKALYAEHGLSFFIETDAVKILFDFGASKATYENAQKLAVPLKKIDYAVCSHGHYDHAGGYLSFVDGGLRCPLLTGIDFFREKYSQSGIKYTYLGIGFTEDALVERHIPHRPCSGVVNFAENCYVIGNFKRLFDFEQIPDRFVVKDGTTKIPDSFDDEICLVLDETAAVTVVVGCSHPGILNILSTVHAYFKKPIRAVFGGTHLAEAHQDRIEKTLREMQKMGIGLIGFNHCSGSLWQQTIAQHPEIQAVYLSSGDSIEL